jgi:hypothetical protein
MLFCKVRVILLSACHSFERHSDDWHSAYYLSSKCYFAACHSIEHYSADRFIEKKLEKCQRKIAMSFH